MSDNFSATKPGQAIPVTAAMAVHPLTADARHASDAMLDNRGNGDAYIMFGGPDVEVQKATGFRIIAGAMIALGKGSATHVAVIGDSVSTLTLHFGKGN